MIMIKDGVTQSLQDCATNSISNAPRGFECVFGHMMICVELNKSMLYPSQTNLVPIHSLRKDERLSCPAWNSKPGTLNRSAACDSRRLLRLRQNAPFIVFPMLLLGRIYYKERMNACSSSVNFSSSFASAD